MNYSKVLHYFFTKDEDEKNSSRCNSVTIVEKTFVKTEDNKFSAMTDNLEEMPCSSDIPITIPADNFAEIAPTPATNQAVRYPGDVKIEDAAPQTLKSLAYKMRSILETKNKTICQLQRKNRQQVRQIEKLKLLVKELRKQNNILGDAAQSLHHNK